MSFIRVFRATSIRQFAAVPQRPRTVLRQLPRTAATCPRRSFFKDSASEDAATQQASEKASEVMTRFMQSQEWRTISAHPPAVKAIEKFMETVASKGLSLQPGQTPKMRDMMKLAMDPDFRTAVQNMKTEIKNAGVDLENAEFMKNIMGSAGAQIPTRNTQTMEIDAEASTSQLRLPDPDQPEDLETIVPTAPSNEATEHHLPQSQFYSVEYPGYVKDSSVSKAIDNLGGQARLDCAFKRMAPKTESFLELSLHPENPFSHPIPGDVVNTNNLLLKVTRRRRKQPNGAAADGIIGEYKAEVVGVIAKTARFRGMADFQYLPDMNDPISRLRMAMDTMNVDAISSYHVPSEAQQGSTSTWAGDVPMEIDPSIDPELLQHEPQLTPSTPSTSSPPVDDLRLFPPPLFSRQTIAQGYNFKANSASIVTTSVDEETGEERKRLINKMRWKGYGPASIMFSDALVPTKPPDAVEKARDQASTKLLERLHELFEIRPIWTRMSLFNQFTPLESREILNSKVILPLVCYVFQDGPWRDTLVKFGYDPRTDNRARLYQRLYFRNANHPISRPSVTTRRQDRTNVNLHIRSFEQADDRKNSHIFDGKTVSKETAAFQLCDIVDSMLREMIEDPESLRESCDERDGWYTSHAFDRIKTVLRHKFFSVLEGHPATDEECRTLLANTESSSKSSSLLHRNQKLRAGKHNMAKGALRPEDAAAIRLRATLDRNVKSLSTQR